MSYQPQKTENTIEDVAFVVRDAGGQIVGRTKLQKIFFLLEAAGLGSNFSFHYRHYGPYSEQLNEAIALARYAGMLIEKEHIASWGGTYSIYDYTGPEASQSTVPSARKKLLECGAKADPVELELAATAAYLFIEGDNSPWQSTQKRKPEKATPERLLRSKALYEKFRVASEERLPQL
jgi:uncharacterized protein